MNEAELLKSFDELASKRNGIPLNTAPAGFAMRASRRRGRTKSKRPSLRFFQLGTRFEDQSGVRKPRRGARPSSTLQVGYSMPPTSTAEVGTPVEPRSPGRQTVGEVLDQAETLLKANHHVAAAVLAGGALETHLLHLCSRNGITVQGALVRRAPVHRGDSPSGRSRRVEGASGTRNEAAHTPTTFKSTPVEVGLMVDSIRQFIARVP